MRLLSYRKKYSLYTLKEIHMTKLTSRERILRTLEFEETDYLPCCFMSFTALRKRLSEDLFALSKAELDMGLDSMLFIPSAGRPQRRDHPDLRGLPVRPEAGVKMKLWSEAGADGQTILHKEYDTPAGSLSTAVKLSEDWTHGNHIPFIDDFQIPRMLKPLITSESDLDALQTMLTPPSEEDKAAYREESERARNFVNQHGPLLAGGWGVGLDMANWLCGMNELMMMAMDQPAFVEQVLEMIHVWNMQRMEVVLSAPVDLYIRRAWYEGVDFVMPKFFRRAVLPRLKREVDLAHERGAKFGYICTSGMKPLLESYLEAGIDVLIGVDPVQGTHTDMPHMKKVADNKMALWGGVSGAVTVEQGTEAEIREAVRTAVSTLGPRGLILSPIDNITIDEPQTWQNIDLFIDEWRKVR
jgi:uroporphyrinogen-III decarboxylase